MTSKGKQKGESPESTASVSRLRCLQQQSQLDFEIQLFGNILKACPDWVDLLKVMGNNLTLRKRYKEGLEIDRRLVRLRPRDPLAHYNLACSFALLRRTDFAVSALKKAVELGYRDFRYIKKDKDLDSIRNDLRYRQLISQFEEK